MPALVTVKYPKSIEFPADIIVTYSIVLRNVFKGVVIPRAKAPRVDEDVAVT